MAWYLVERDQGDLVGDDEQADGDRQIEPARREFGFNVAAADPRRTMVVGRATPRCRRAADGSDYVAVTGKNYVPLLELDTGEQLTEAGVTNATLGDVRDTVLRVRRSKSMVLDPADPNCRSCGSFFTNPILEPAEFEQLERHVAEQKREGDLPVQAVGVVHALEEEVGRDGQRPERDDPAEQAEEAQDLDPGDQPAEQARHGE